MSISFTTKCPDSKCGKFMLVDGNSVGRSVICPECRYLFRVQSFQAVKPGTDPALPFAEPRDCSDQVDESEELPLNSLGRFELRKVLGKGGFGRVYLAWDPHLERLVALKVAFSGPENTKQRERVLREAKAQLLLQHDAIVPAFECDQIDGCLYIVFEYVEGESLSSRIRRGPVERRQAVEWVRDLADALAFAHTHRVIHRDVKPHNILIDLAGRPFLTDFGLAHWVDDGGDLTRPGSFTGTIPYMAPELLSGHGPAGGRETEFYCGVDQYSLGVVLYELLTGHRPFEGRFTAVVAMKIAQDPPCPSRYDPRIPGDLAAICLKALHRDPQHRHRDCASLAMALTEWLTESESIVRPGRERTERTSLRIKVFTLHLRWKEMGLFALASVLLLLTVATFVDAWSGKNSAPDPVPDQGQPVVFPKPHSPVSLDLHSGKMSATDVRQSQETWARRLGVKVPYTNSIGMQFCLVPPGQFIMGTSEKEREAVRSQRPPQGEISAVKARESEHAVEIRAPFFLSQHEVTVGQYELTTGTNPSGSTSSRAVGNITYQQALDFCQKLTLEPKEKEAGRRYRLPTEAEWEFSCRANFSIVKDTSGGALGLKDLLGGVSEWCSDWFQETSDERRRDAVNDPSGPESGTMRVVRGGSNRSPEWFQRPGYRGVADPKKGDESRGFRVILELEFVR